MRLVTFLALFVSAQILFSQDTIRVMHYNLLYYGNSAFCNENNNNTGQKDAFMRTVLTYARPDIVTVNEMSKNSTYHQRMLSEVFNQSGYALFDMVPGSNIAGENIMNLMFYNTEKLGYHSHATAQSLVRDIDVFRLYSLDLGLDDGDTVFLSCVVGHLKAGDDQGDENDRADMVENTLDYLEAVAPSGNYLFMGDFNFQESSEEAYQLMTGNSHPVFRFFDPAGAEGDWHNNSAYRHVHTQSTRTSQANNCGAWGGMDDRFDFIMMNSTIHDEVDRVGYLDDTYWALGQDGLRFNGSIADPPNTSVPAYVVDALLGMSDHLPVVMDLCIADDLGVAATRYPVSDIRYANPVKDELKLYFDGSHSRTLIFSYSLISSTGVKVQGEQLSTAGGSIVSVDVSSLPPGFYILHIQSASGYFTGKLIISR